MSINTNHITDTVTPTTGSQKVAGKLVLPNTSGNGIQVDTTTPVWTWQDMLGAITVRGVGSADPTWNVYRGNIRQYQFATTNEVALVFHIPHDYVPGSDLFVHAHWSLATGGVSQTCTWGFDASYAKGHQQAAFSAPVTVLASQASSTTQYQHMIAEVQLSNAGGTGGLLDTSLIEVDGLVIIRAFLSANTGGTDPFLHTVDIHYQSTNIGTKNKAPNFWS